MSQDTRKDKRAKVVSLNVRYKSATVDEFIENHSHDVSKGGLFVKTPTPFPPGTLLKFEIRLAGDKSVISGVGRVVWKRDPTQSGAEKPAGMGVKFIKIDDSSRAIIDRLIMQKADAGSAYTSEQPIEEAGSTGHASTLRGLVAAAPVEPGPPPGPSPVTAPPPAAGGTTKLPVPPPAAPPPAARAAAAPPPAAPPPPVAKSPAQAGTLAGPRPSGPPNVPPSAPVVPPAPSSKPGLGGALGAPKPPPRPGGPPPPVANKPSTAVGVGPAPPAPAAVISAAAVPVEKPPSEPKLGAARPPVPTRKATMMGMATPPPPPAETSVPSPTPPPAPVATAAPAAVRGGTAEPMFPRLDPESGSEPARDQTVMKQAAELLEEALKEAGGSLDEIGQNPLFSQAGEAVQSGDTMIMTSPTPSGLSPSSPLGAPAPAITAASSLAASSPSQPLILDAPASAKAPAVSSPRKLSEDLAQSKKKGGSTGALVGALLALTLVGGGVYAWQTGMLAGVIGPEKATPSASTSPPTPPSSTPSATSSAPIVATTTDAAIAVADAAATPTTTDAAAAGTSEVDAGKAATTAVAPTPPTPPPPTPPVKPRPPAPPKPPPPPPPVETTTTPTAEPPPAPTPTPTPTPAPTPATPPAPTMEPWSPP